MSVGEGGHQGGIDAPSDARSLGDHRSAAGHRGQERHLADERGSLEGSELDDFLVGTALLDLDAAMREQVKGAVGVALFDQDLSGKKLDRLHHQGQFVEVVCVEIAKQRGRGKRRMGRESDAFEIEC